MTQKQFSAIARLKKALDRCHAVGLQGGVYDGSFCLWPVEGVDPRDTENFFGAVDNYGMSLREVKMSLDGGAGV